MDKYLVNKFLTIMEDMKKSIISKTHDGDLSKSEFSILYFIKEYEKDNIIATTSLLSERLQISKPAISQMINVLEDKKYLQRIINKDDRRLICVVMTELGNSLLKKQMEKVSNIVNMIMDEMGTVDSRLFVDLFERYVSILKDILDRK
jgi:DNA-binding MarR family transcriptional regulator